MLQFYINKSCFWDLHMSVILNHLFKLFAWKIEVMKTINWSRVNVWGTINSSSSNILTTKKLFFFLLFLFFFLTFLSTFYYTVLFLSFHIICFRVAGPGGGKLQNQGKINTLKTEDNFISLMAIIFLWLNLIFKMLIYFIQRSPGPHSGRIIWVQDHMMDLTVKVPIPNSVWWHIRKCSMFHSW